MKLPAIFLAITPAVFIGTVSAKTTPSGEVSPVANPSIDGAECPNVESIDATKWTFTRGRQSVVGVSNLYASLGVVPDLSLAPPSAAFKWIGKVTVDVTNTCVYLMQINLASRSTNEYLIAKTPAQPAGRTSYMRSDTMDARLASKLSYHLAKAHDEDRRNWLVDKLPRGSFHLGTETAEKYIQRLGFLECRRSLDNIKGEVLLAALKIFEKSSKILSDDVMKPENVQYNEQNAAKVHFLVLSIRMEADYPTNPTTQEATTILKRAVAAAFPDSLCERPQIMANFDASRARTNDAYRLSHWHLL